ncbi:PEGA domain-containing protein [Gracilinema caldarium]|nr:PEGA domain-containing protein [Gracilinema caldarium]
MREPVSLLGLWMLLFIAIEPSFTKEVSSYDSYLESDGTGITINSIPAKAKVYIDGIQRGITPLSLSNLAPGKYQVTLVKEGYEKRTIFVTLLEGKHLDLTLEMFQAMGQLIINLERVSTAPSPEKLPLRAELYVDNIKSDTTFLSLVAGWHKIRIEAFGWDSVEKTVLVLQDFTQVLTVSLEPAQFKISDFRSERIRLNPHNPGLLGSAGIAFQVNATGTGSIIIYDTINTPVYEYHFKPFTEYTQRMNWMGTDKQGNKLPDGLYRVVLTATSIPYDMSDPIQYEEELFIHIDSSLVIRPWSIGSGGAGLVYLSIPETIAPLSFQTDTRLAFGFPFGVDNAFSSVPFSLGLRFSPIDTWEISFSGEFDAHRDSSANQGSLNLRKKLFAANNSIPLALGADFSWTLSEVSTHDDPYMVSWSGAQGGPRFGLSFLIPLGSYFSVGMSPGLVWSMDMFTYHTSPIPNYELEMGILGIGETITGGVSAKMLWQNVQDTQLSWNKLLIMTATELHWFPKPSVLVFHLSGGLWLFQEKLGGFGSIGFGLIH